MRSTYQSHAEGRHDRLPSIRRCRDGETQTLQDAGHVGVRHRHAQQRGEARAAQFEPCGLARTRISVDRRQDQLAAPDPIQQRRDPLKRDDRGVDVGAALEARGGFGLEIQPLAGAPDRRGLEICALEHDALRAGRHLRPGAAHDAGDRLRPIAIGDDEHLGVERALDAVERGDGFAGAPAPHPDLRSGEVRQIESMRRMADLHEHVVGQIDDRVDRPDAGRLQTPGHPGGRGADGDFGDGGRIPRTGSGSSIVTESSLDLPTASGFRSSGAIGRP